jgi:hypothetical protein
VFDSVPSDAVGYVASAYLFFLLVVLVYIAILGAKFQRISRELGKLIDEVESAQEGGADSAAESPRQTTTDSPLREESGV